ncbi:MAG: 50S ribosomal protein L19e [archaeon]
MNLSKKKILAAKALGVGKARIILNTERIAEIKEAITRQDIKDLAAAGAITVRPVSGRRTIVKRKTRRRFGSIRKKINNNKREYMNQTRKLRAYIQELRKHETISEEKYWALRKQIRARLFKSKAHLKEQLGAKA